MPPAPPPSYDEGRRSVWIGAGITAAALALAVIGLSAAGVLRFGAPKVEPSLPAYAQKPKPSLQLPREPGVSMPNDIRAWLEHLERIEKARVRLSKDQIRNLMIDKSELDATAYADVLKSFLGEGYTSGETPPEYDSKNRASEIVDSIRPDWKALAEEFETVPPPEECREIAGKYSQVLRETGAASKDVNDIMERLGGDPHEAIKKLKDLLKSHETRIDKPAIEVDHAVEDICDKYDTRKWFDIAGDIGNGGSLMSPNLPGLGGMGGLGG